jgi:hypothetical protein
MITQYREYIVKYLLIGARVSIEQEAGSRLIRLRVVISVKEPALLTTM